ncbi:MAG: DnaJ domain-containing protein, partial [Myxococcales bacterium]|nr:DnaJ domain-containing protein [Myxococcales bacterium]
DPEQVAQMEQVLAQQLERFKKLDGYTILGLDSTAGGAQVKAAYEKLVKSYHPHHFARYGPKVGKLATKLFVHVQRAHREAIEIVKTRAYDNDAGERRGRTGPRAGRTLEAQAISQALQLLSLSQFDSAGAVLDEALSRAPDSKNLQLHRHLVDARAHRARGNSAGAIQSYRAILALHPQHDEARIELDNLERAAVPSGGGLFKRFKGAR